MAHLLLVRHATSVPPRRDGPGDEVRPLSPRGFEQAEQLAVALAARRPGRFVSSPHLRARQTVQPAAALLGLVVEQREELREWESGLAAKDDWQVDYRRSWEDPDLRHADGESHRELERRAVRAVRAIAAGAGDGTTVVGSHGTWIARALLGLGQPVDANFWLDMPMPAVFDLVLEGGVVRDLAGPGLLRG